MTNQAVVMQYDPARSEQNIFSVFAQDEFAVASRLSVTGGVKFEHHDSVGAALQPSARAVWTPVNGHRVWGGVARGVRTPSLADQIATFHYLVIPPSAATQNLPILVRVAGDPNQTDPESVVAYETGYRAQWSQNFAVDVTAFYNRYSHLNSYNRGPLTFSMAGGVPHLDLVSIHQNLIAGSSHGIESVATWTPTASWTVTGTSTFLSTSLHLTDPMVAPGNSFLVLLLSPSRQFSVRSTNRINAAFDVETSVFWNGKWQMGGVDRYARTDVRGGWKIDRSVTLDVGVQNLFDNRHREASDYLFERATDVTRSAYARLAWSF
jgi:outer membrane receptor for ferrienterochelin and colicin